MLSSRREVLDGREEVGDEAAPHGSPGWVRYLRYHTITVKRDARSLAIQLKDDLVSLRKEERWKVLSDQKAQPFSSWEDFCQYPEPLGLGMKAGDVEAILAESDPNKTVRQVLAKHGRPKKNEEGKGSRRTFNRGDNDEYAEARLRRDAEKNPLARLALARAESGELGWREAAHEAGLLKRRSAYSDLCSAWRRASPDERDRFEEWQTEWRRRPAA